RRGPGDQHRDGDREPQHRRGPAPAGTLWRYRFGQQRRREGGGHGAAATLQAHVPEHEDRHDHEAEQHKRGGEAHRYAVGGDASVATTWSALPPLLISSVTLSPEC